MRTCHRCATTDDTDDPAWALDREEGGTRWLCPHCVRVHARDIEARLPPEWWS